MKLHRARALLVIATLLPVAAMAEIPVYAGGSVGRGDVNASAAQIRSDLTSAGHTITGVTYDGEDSGYRVYAGIRLARYFAVELGYIDLGSANGSISGVATDALIADVPRIVPVMPRGATLAAVAVLPTTLLGVSEDSMWSRVSVLLKGGVVDPDTSTVVTLPGNRTAAKVQNAASFYGLGFQFDVTSRVAFRAEVENYDYARSVRFPSASLQYRFR